MRATAFLLAAALLAGCGRAGPRGDAPPAPKPEPVAPPAPPPPPVGERIEHPSYKLWGRFPVGASVTQQTTTRQIDKPGKTVTTIIYTLKAKSDAALVVESQATTAYADGREQANPAEEFTYARWVAPPPGVKKEDRPAVAAFEEVTALGRTFPCRKTEVKNPTDAGEMRTETWSSDAMPGGLVRSVSVVPKVNVTSTVEVTELKLP